MPMKPPKYTSAIVGLITCYSGMMVIGIGYSIFAYFIEIRREHMNKVVYNDEIAKQAVIDGFNDLTDFENRGFRDAI